MKAEQELMAAPKVFVDFFKEVKRGFDLDRERERQNKGK
jgi:hypothetical protein